ARRSADRVGLPPGRAGRSGGLKLPPRGPTAMQPSGEANPPGPGRRSPSKGSPPVVRRLCWFVLVAGMALGGTPARAATVSVQVADRAGKPLADAVVMLVPVSGHLPVKPMSGVEIAQSHRQFSPQVTVVTVGTSIAFPNLDTVRHHVYSFSPVKSFELKLYAGVPATPIVFDKPGIATLGCNIHDAMV